MAGIPVFTSSPINPNVINPTQAEKAPTTTAAPEFRNPWPVSVEANTTATATNSAQSAQPVAAAPTPTSTASAQYTPYSPTRTTTAAPPPPSVGTRQSPPPPQPGQAPTSTSPRSRNTKRPSYADPPPPQPSYTLPSSGAGSNLPPLQTNTQPINYPLPTPRTPSFKSPPQPTRTSNLTTQFHQSDLSHPPGYQQNTSASFHDRPISDEDYNHNKTHTPSPTRKGMGLLDFNPTYETPGEDSPIWDAAISWAKAAGKRLSVGEAQIWKAINGESR